MHRSLQTLFERHVAGSFDKQLFLAELIGQSGWAFDAPHGTIAFDGQAAWRVQVLGTVSSKAGHWRWSWSDGAEVLPPRLLKVSQGLRRLGALRDISELITPLLPNGESVGVRLALIAGGVFKCNGFYRAPYATGAAFLLICDPAYPQNDVTPAVRVPFVMPQVLKRYPDINHRRVLMGYLKHYRLTHRRLGDDLIIMNDGGPILRARFEQRDRLAGIEVL